MPEDSNNKIEILWGEPPVILTRDIVFAAKHLDGIPSLEPGTVVLLPADAVLIKLPSKANKEEVSPSKDPDDISINIGD